MKKLSFASDYMEGAHPAILQRLIETNMEKTEGYGTDEFSESARNKIRAACGASQADVYFLAGGTQTNAVIIDALLRTYQGVIAAKSGHINVHEAGAIEFGGHKILELEHNNGRISASNIERYIRGYWQDENHEHMVMPGMVYISQPTEYGTLYSLKELKEISRVCRENHIPLYLDGARLAYALACPENDVELKDLAALCDVFYIGGTKCGALYGEAVVIPEHGFIPHMLTIIKQHGALLAKGRIAGIQFDVLFSDGFYEKIGQTAIETADMIRRSLMEKGYQFAFHTPSNQIFVILDKDRAAVLSERIAMGFWENIDDLHAVFRIATSWATEKEDVRRLIDCL